MPAVQRHGPVVGSLPLTHASHRPIRSNDCVGLLNTLGESCRNALLKGITGSDNEYIAKYGAEFFNTCSGVEGAQAAPAPSVDLPAIEEPVEKPVEVPVEVPVEKPTELPMTGVSNVAIAVPAILSVLAMI